MQTFKVTEVIKSFAVYYVEAETWEKARYAVENKEEAGKGIEPHHIDEDDERNVCYIDSEDGKITYYED